MVRQVFEILGDVIISILVLLAILLVLVACFYKDIALTQVIPESEKYMLTQEMKKELEDTNLQQAEEVIVNYYIDASDLNKYEKRNEYVKGKSNPFAEVVLSEESNNSENSTSSTNSNSGFYEDDGTK